MPYDRWAQPPVITPHGYGYSMPLDVGSGGSGTEEDPYYWDGVRLEVKSFSAFDIEAAINADPDCTPDMLDEALALAAYTDAPTIQGQIDELTDFILGGGA